MFTFKFAFFWLNCHILGTHENFLTKFGRSVSNYLSFECGKFGEKIFSGFRLIHFLLGDCFFFAQTVYHIYAWSQFVAAFNYAARACIFIASCHLLPFGPTA